MPTNDTHDTDAYDQYEADFDPLTHDRQARRKRKPKPVHTPKATRQPAPVNETPDESPITEDGLTHITYRPSQYEAVFLAQSLRPFFERHLITDVLASVKGGKEASVYCVVTHPETAATLGVDLLAAKVYRPRMFRSLRNDSAYREGRGVMVSETGTLLKANEDRVVRAMKKKTEFGAQVAHTSWLMYEYTTLQALYDAGAAVPRPVAVEANAILMTYVGDADGAAPRLADIDIDDDEAVPLFDEVVRNIDLMLQHGWIHGDLSAYNILYFEGAITLIDFPQVTDAHNNSNARDILTRDVQRVCDYFAKYGVRSDVHALADGLWKRYVAKSEHMQAADLSRLLETTKEDDQDD